TSPPTAIGTLPQPRTANPATSFQSEVGGRARQAKPRHVNVRRTRRRNNYPDHGRRRSVLTTAAEWGFAWTWTCSSSSASSPHSARDIGCGPTSRGGGAGAAPGNGAVPETASG